MRPVWFLSARPCLCSVVGAKARFHRQAKANPRDCPAPVLARPAARPRCASIHPYPSHWPLDTGHARAVGLGLGLWHWIPRRLRPSRSCGRTIKEAFSSSMAAAQVTVSCTQRPSHLSSAPAPGQRSTEASPRTQQATGQQARMKTSVLQTERTVPTKLNQQKEKEVNKQHLPPWVLVAPCRGTSSAGTPGR